MKVLVTGGSGFIGSNLLRSLSELHPDWTLFNLDLFPPRSATVGSYISADITSLESVSTAIISARPDAIIHTAGFVPSGQDRYSLDPKLKTQVWAINVTGTKNVLSAAQEAGVKALVYTSSCTVIADDLLHDYPLMNETVPLHRATTLYGQSKALAEDLVLSSNTPALRTCALRPATVLGPGDTYGVLDVMMAVVANGETPFIVGSGNNLYDFVYIDNVVHAHVLALEDLQRAESKAAGQAVFVSNHEPIYIRDLMEAVWAQCAGHVPAYRVRLPVALAWTAGLAAEVVSWVSGRGSALSRGSVQDAVGIRYADNTKAVTVLGYKPIVGFAEGVRRTCEAWRAEKEKKR